MRQLSLATLMGVLALTGCGDGSSDTPDGHTGHDGSDGSPDGAGDGAGADGNGADGSGADGNGADGNGADGNGADGSGADGSGADGAGDGEGELTLNGFPVADHCTPGDYDLRSIESCLGAELTSALNAGVGATPSPERRVHWVELTTPMVANQPYAVSNEITPFGEANGFVFEVWGVDSVCAVDGEQAELLGSTPVNRGRAVYCVEGVPSKAYSHVLFAYRWQSSDDGFAYHGQTYCAMGQCPAP